MYLDFIPVQNLQEKTVGKLPFHLVYKQNRLSLVGIKSAALIIAEKIYRFFAVFLTQRHIGIAFSAA